jgi:hypothetical protein
MTDPPVPRPSRPSPSANSETVISPVAPLVIGETIARALRASHGSEDEAASGAAERPLARAAPSAEAHGRARRTVPKKPATADCSASAGADSGGSEAEGARETPPAVKEDSPMAASVARPAPAGEGEECAAAVAEATRTTKEDRPVDADVACPAPAGGGAECAAGPPQPQVQGSAPSPKARVAATEADEEETVDSTEKDDEEEVEDVAANQEAGDQETEECAAAVAGVTLTTEEDSPVDADMARPAPAGGGGGVRRRTTTAAGEGFGSLAKGARRRHRG